MSQWGSAKARKVLAALLRIGWTIKRESRGSHRILSRPGWARRGLCLSRSRRDWTENARSYCEEDGIATSFSRSFGIRHSCFVIAVGLIRVN